MYYESLKPIYEKIKKEELKVENRKKIIKEKAIEEALWESANKLRGSVEPSEYKHVVLSLIFLKYAHFYILSLCIILKNT